MAGFSGVNRKAPSASLRNGASRRSATSGPRTIPAPRENVRPLTDSRAWECKRCSKASDEACAGVLAAPALRIPRNGISVPAFFARTTMQRREGVIQMRYSLLTSCAIAAIALGGGLAKAQGPAQVQGQGQTQAQGSGQTTEQGRPDAQRQREPSTGRQTLDERSNANAGRREGTERREER